MRLDSVVRLDLNYGLGLLSWTLGEPSSPVTLPSSGARTCPKPPDIRRPR